MMYKAGDIVVIKLCEIGANRLNNTGCFAAVTKSDIVTHARWWQLWKYRKYVKIPLCDFSNNA